MRTYTAEDGKLTISWLDSFLTWRMIGHGTLPVPEIKEGQCQFCGGFPEGNDVKYGPLICACELQRLQKIYTVRLRPFRSAISERNMAQFEAWGDTRNRSTLAQVKKIATEWIEKPDTWMTILGNPGVGKSHILSAMDKALSPWALYVTAYDFERQIFDALGDDTLSVLLDIIRRAPFLLFDDLGSEYVKEGKDFLRSNLRKIIDFRYERWEEYPTVITSNLTIEQLRAYDPRIADRITDSSVASLIEMYGPSWRQRGDS